MNWPRFISEWRCRWIRANAIRRLHAQSSGILRELLEMSPAERLSLLGRPDVRNALTSLGRDQGLRWLEIAVDSPVMPSWGALLYALNPTWEDLDRWVRLSKEHCLAAMDAVEAFTLNDADGPGDTAYLPEGADHEKMNHLVDEALSLYENPRLRFVEKRVRHAWPLGPRIRTPISIPVPIMRAAEWLFVSKASLVRQWITSIETAIDPPENHLQIWYSLIYFADRACVLAVFDWNVGNTDVIGRIREMPTAKNTAIEWLYWQRFEGEVPDLCRGLAREFGHCDKALLELDTGGSDWGLAVMPNLAVPDLLAVGKECLKSAVAIRQL